MEVDAISSIVNFKLDNQQQYLNAKMTRKKYETSKAVMDAMPFNPNGNVDIRA